MPSLLFLLLCTLLLHNICVLAYVCKYHIGFKNDILNLIGLHITSLIQDMVQSTLYNLHRLCEVEY